MLFAGVSVVDKQAIVAELQKTAVGAQVDFGLEEMGEAWAEATEKPKPPPPTQHQLIDEQSAPMMSVPSGELSDAVATSADSEYSLTSQLTVSKTEAEATSGLQSAECEGHALQSCDAEEDQDSHNKQMAEPSVTAEEHTEAHGAENVQKGAAEDDAKADGAENVQKGEHSLTLEEDFEADNGEIVQKGEHSLTAEDDADADGAEIIRKDAQPQVDSKAEKLRLKEEKRIDRDAAKAAKAEAKRVASLGKWQRKQEERARKLAAKQGLPGAEDWRALLPSTPLNLLPPGTEAIQGWPGDNVPPPKGDMSLHVELVRQQL
eukprot:SAG31_NODE_1883_length_6996_cov_8.247499_4_plen_319_part_00